MRKGGRKSFPNIEFKRSYSYEGRSYYAGYSNIGIVRIYGEAGYWGVFMGNSLRLQQEGLAYLPVRSCVHDLATVSKIIDHLKIEIRDGKKVITCL